MAAVEKHAATATAAMTSDSSSSEGSTSDSSVSKGNHTYWCLQSPTCPVVCKFASAFQMGEAENKRKNTCSKAGSALEGNMFAHSRLALCQMTMQNFDSLPSLTLLLFSVIIQPQ